MAALARQEEGGMRKAQRDMTRAQFKAALQRRGWRKVLSWIEIDSSHSIGMVVVNNKLHLRASLAKAIEASKRFAA